MADNLCGPSNPLQSLQKQSSADRSLQQDRLASRSTPSQGFRSQGTNAGALDPEFNSFQAGQIPLPGLENHGINPAAFHSNLAQRREAAFQSHRQHVSNHGLQQSGQTPLDSNRSSSASWNADFQRQYGHTSGQGHIQHDPRFGGPSFGTGWTVLQGSAAPMTMMNLNLPSQSVQHDQGQATEDPFSQEEWDELFAQAAAEDEAKAEAETMQDLTEELGAQHLSGVAEEQVELGQDITINETLQTQTDHLQETQRLGADLIVDPITDLPREQRAQRDPHEDNEALARTAGYLLESVSTNTTDKFRNSQFLKLMQQFRDREVVVQGDKIIHMEVEPMSSEVGVVSS